MDAVARFAVAGEARSDLLNRVVGLIAQLGLTPLRVSMCRQGDMALLAIMQDGLEPVRATILAEKMRALVMVGSVELTFASMTEMRPCLRTDCPMSAVA